MTHFTCDVSDQCHAHRQHGRRKVSFWSKIIVASVIFAQFLLSKTTNFVRHYSACIFNWFCNVAYFSVLRVLLPYWAHSFSFDQIDLVQQICLDLDQSDCLIQNAFIIEQRWTHNIMESKGQSSRSQWNKLCCKQHFEGGSIQHWTVLHWVQSL